MDTATRNELVTQAIPLAKSIAIRFASKYRFADPDDLASEALLQLTLATDTYDERISSFKTFAGVVMERRMQNCVRRYMISPVIRCLEPEDEELAEETDMEVNAAFVPDATLFIASLTEKEQTLLKLRLLGKSQWECAKLMSKRYSKCTNQSTMSAMLSSLGKRYKQLTSH